MTERVTICSVCGHPIPPRKGRGRPASFHAPCKKIQRLTTWTETTIEEIRPLLSDEARNKLRRTFRYFSNLLNTKDYIGDEEVLALFADEPDAE